MKKIMTWLLVLTMILSCSAVFAESAGTEKQELGTVDLNGAFILKGVIPEGYTYQVNSINPGMSLDADVIKLDDPNAPYMNIMVYLDDSYAPGTRLNDLDEETLREIEESFSADNDVEFEYLETAHGTKLLKVTEVGDDPDWIAFYSIYEGYEVELTVRFREEAENPVLSDEVSQKAVQFLSDMDFVKVEE